MDGTIIRGANNAAGEVGYMLFNREQLYAPTDKGYFEILCAGSGIEVSYHKLKGGKLSPEAIFKLAAQGDLTAKYIVDKFSDYLAIGILNINAVINPEKILLMGGVTKSAGHFLEEVNQKIANQTFSNTKIKVELSSLKEQAPLYGAAVLGLSTVFPTINFIKERNPYPIGVLSHNPKPIWMPLNICVSGCDFLRASLFCSTTKRMGNPSFFN